MNFQSIAANSFATLLRLRIKISAFLFRTSKYHHYVSMNREIEYGMIESSSYMYYYLKYDGSLRYKSLENYLNEFSVSIDRVMYIKLDGVPYQLTNVDGDYTYVRI
jgi:hypothetical protein